MNWNIVLLAVLLSGCVIEETEREKEDCDENFCTNLCNYEGKCRLVDRNGDCSCIADSSEQCVDSVDCFTDGNCTLVDGECRLTGWWDCEHTWGCEHQCVLNSGGCGFNGVECVNTCQE